jgi:ATP-dependent Clp protease ATP-binding subunit ClpX
MTDNIEYCSFCAKHKGQVGKLIVSHKVAICNECVNLCVSLLKDFSKTDQVKKENSKTIPDPLDIKQYLDVHVIGQDQAKTVLSVAIANHYKRISNADSSFQKSNILMIGPTGTGKTLMARTVAKYLDVPFITADATSLTEAGYVGDDVESIISRLYTASDNDVQRCQRGIVFLDEVDKIAKKGESATLSRDVSGEGVQQALLKLIEGTKCRISATGNKKNSSGDLVEIDTRNILFVAGGAFIGLDKIVQKRTQGTSMGFNAALTVENSNLDEVTPDDLIKYGMIPEFVGRFGNCISLHALNKKELISILTQVKDNFVEQYKWLFNLDGVQLDFEPESLEVIAERTLKTQTGARGLHSELERVLMPHMFDLPRYRKQNILQIIINKEQVNTPMTLAQQENA